jgi:hypothetical protein
MAGRRADNGGDGWDVATVPVDWLGSVQLGCE